MTDIYCEIFIQMIQQPTEFYQVLLYIVYNKFSVFDLLSALSSLQ